MNNTEKKLDALIDALGFDVESVTDIKRIYKREDLQDKGEPKANAIPNCIIDNTTYKLTKRKLPPVTFHHCRKCGTHIGKGNPLDSCLCKTSKFLVESTGHNGDDYEKI